VPVTVGKNARVRRDIEEAGFGVRQIGEGPATRPRVKGHLVAAGPAGDRNVLGKHCLVDFSIGGRDAPEVP
jgi:hypothetical protein